MEQIHLYARAKTMRELGASMYGGDLSKWPAKTVDSFMLIQEESARVDRLSVSPPKASTPTVNPINRKRR